MPDGACRRAPLAAVTALHCTAAGIAIHIVVWAKLRDDVSCSQPRIAPGLPPAKVQATGACAACCPALPDFR